MDGLGRVEVFRTVPWFDGLRQLPQRLLADEIIKVIEQRDDFLVLLQLIVAARHTHKQTRCTVGRSPPLSTLIRLYRSFRITIHRTNCYF